MAGDPRVHPDRDHQRWLRRHQPGHQDHRRDADGFATPKTNDYAPAAPPPDEHADVSTPSNFEEPESRGASNAKAKRELGWTLRCPSWRQGFVDAYT